MSATAFKILTAQQWTEFARNGIFHGAPIDVADGYIHLSTTDQLAETLARHFAGQTGLVIAEIDLAPYGDAVKWEPSRGGQLFPHIYSALNLASVVATQYADDTPGGERLCPEIERPDQ
ncbi:MAG: DUF952 domain-containing protein [Sphingopyxis sp.]|nr:DUF952 domain-containing protein [Sphingopyxis sp.]